ncbi:MAG: phosphatase PAP2 family protein [Candidatus Cloacimonadales bacterium]|nr:phosphatase PAP2 family protein [Candidatus Cloacimonadales bacterium]
MKKMNLMIWPDFGISILILAIFTILFRKFDWDISIQKHFFTLGGGWIFKNAQPWKFLYHFGNIPALCLSVSSLILLSFSFFKTSLIKYRKIFIFMTIVMALGPGLFINSILKDNWGRPRPRDIIEFGGNYNYEKVLSIDTTSKGKSFPCGHASMGFYLMTLFFIFRKRMDLTAHRALYLGIVFGCLIGMARMVQGGHFASDVLWAGGLVYLISAAAFYSLKMDRSIFVESTADKLPIKRNLLVMIIIAAAIALTLLILMSGSQSYTKTFSYKSYTNKLELKIEIERGDVEFIDGDSISINVDYVAHGFPWSKVKTKVRIKEFAEYQSIALNQRESGYFTEVDQTITVLLPDSLDYDISVKIEEGNLILTDFSNEIEMETVLGNGRVIQ